MSLKIWRHKGMPCFHPMLSVASAGRLGHLACDIFQCLALLLACWLASEKKCPRDRAGRMLYCPLQLRVARNTSLAPGSRERGIDPNAQHGRVSVTSSEHLGRAPMGLWKRRAAALACWGIWRRGSSFFLGVSSCPAGPSPAGRGDA